MITAATKKRKAAQKVNKPAHKTARREIVPSYDRHIEVTPGIRGGKPRVVGRRIAVEDIVSMHLKHGQTVQHIIDSYNLLPAQVYAALTYYYDHRNEIDQSLAEGVARYETDKAAHPSLAEQKRTMKSLRAWCSGS